MKPFLLLFVGLIFLTNLWGQKSDYATCNGSVSISANAVYRLNFLGKSKHDQLNLFGYAKEDSVSTNTIWLNYTPATSGELSLQIQSCKTPLSIYILECPTENVCQKIKEKEANLLFHESIPATNQTTKFPNLFLPEGKTYYFAFNTKKNSRDSLVLKLGFEAKTETGEKIVDSVLLDMAHIYGAPIYHLILIDEQTKLPVTARIYLSEAGNLDGTYRASHLYLNNTKKLKATIRLDAQGYFSKDLFLHKIDGSRDTYDTIALTSLSKGSTAKLDDINFVGGLAIILDESLPKLKRLKDFLVLNGGIAIEIQGHVNGEGKNNLSAQRLSKKRAEKIIRYLIDNGVDSRRLSAVGFGNTKPIFTDPKDDNEREANRRVEIQIN